MDRTEQTGLAAAIVIHALFALLLWFGMQTAREAVPEKESINVSLVGEIGSVSTAPDPVQEAAASAPLADEPVTQMEAAPEPPAPTPMLQPTPVTPPKVTPKVTPKIIPKITPKAVTRPVPAKTTPKIAVKTKPKPVAKTPTKTAPKSGGFGAGFEGRIAGIGGSGSSAGSNASSGAGKAAGAPAAKSGAEVRRSVTTALAGQIRPFLQACAPSGVDVDKISTFITINMAANGSVTGVSVDRPQTGVNDSNRPQADPLQQCAVRAAKQASPYRGLDPAYHDLWKSHRMQLKAR